ncbi:TetR/AcrR family transcriptional regulator [Actinoplanes utahensis]|uniref:TetR/AcrR family transcriptional regulator n=1 Tax=Actinoplanes utahensis TaxID=1869 RepID=UPI00068AFFFA|nr:TetR family transcriptional regulator [Actinoplanes utahensis]
MGRVSKEQAAHNRERIVATAARLFRERGIAGVSVADVMAEAGFTHGGFYKHFASKDALVAEAVTDAFAEQTARMRDRAGLMDAYLTTAHRDDPGGGCPTAGFGGDVARAGGGDATRRAYAEGVEGFARRIGTGGEEDLAALSTMVGALLLARATEGTDLSGRILESARAALGLNPVADRHAAGSAPAPSGSDHPE